MGYLMAEVETVPTWIYPADGSGGKIVDLAPGAAAPDGYAFSPADVASVAPENTKPARRGKRSRK